MSEIEELFTEKDPIDVLQKIVNELVNDNNLELKTELENPILFAVMDIILQALQMAKLKVSSEVIIRFTKTAFRYLISKNRKGREEFISALNAISNMKKNAELEQLNEKKFI